MILYEIAIERKTWNEEVDMQAVYTALQNAGIDVDKDERRGGNPPSEDDQVEYVFVDAGYVSKAVKVINSLGYETDEDNEQE